MANKKTLHYDLKEENLLDLLFGCDLDMDEETATAILEKCEINSEKLLSDFQFQLENEAKKQRINNGNVPSLMKSALNNLSSKPKFITSEEEDPKSWINKLLSGVLPNVENLEVAYSFRPSDKDLLQSDKEILENLKTKLGGEQKK